MEFAELIHNAVVRGYSAHILKKDATSLQVEHVPNKFFKKWSFWRVANDDIPPRVLYLTTDGTTVHQPELNIEKCLFLTQEKVKPTLEKDAVEYVRFFLRIAAPDIFLLNSPADIPGISEEEIEAWRQKISPLVMKSKDKGYLGQAWLWADGVLSRVEIQISENGELSMAMEELESEIGMVISID